MELFIPTLIVVVITALFAFLIVPRMGPMSLAIISLLALIGAGIHHYLLFSTEYRMSTWQYSVMAYAPLIVFGLALLFIIAAAWYLIKTPFMTSNSNIPEKPLEAINSGMNTLFNAVKTPFAQAQNAIKNMPPASTATNPFTAAINTGLKNIASTLPNMSGNTGPKPPAAGRNTIKSPVIPGLGLRASEI